MAGARAACTWGSGGRPPVSRILGASKRANARFSSKVEESAKNGHVRVCFETGPWLTLLCAPRIVTQKLPV